MNVETSLGGGQILIAPRSGTRGNHVGEFFGSLFGGRLVEVRWTPHTASPRQGPLEVFPRQPSVVGRRVCAETPGRLRFKDFSSCADPPPAGGSKKFPKTSTQPHTLFFGVFGIFGQKRKKNRPKNGPKRAKLPQNRRNNWRGSPRKSQQILKISGKWPKTPPQCKVKMHQKE